MANTLSTSGGAAALVFESTTFSVVTRNDQPWLTMRELAGALYGAVKGGGQSDATFENAEKSLRRLYTRNAAEFTNSMTALVKLPTSGGEQETRIFSLRGAHLLGMFARTAIAANFRKWVLDILDRETQTPTMPTVITTAQCQHLSELVDLVVESGRQKTHAETWARLHRKMKVNSYKLLTPAQFDEACDYLRGKLDDTSLAAIAQKHFPQLVAPKEQQSLDQTVARLAKQVAEPNSYPVELFMPLVNAALERLGMTRLLMLPAGQSREITDRLNRLAGMFHPMSEPFGDAMGVLRALRGMHPRTGIQESGYRMVIGRIAA
jgi:prophage antirepressor-like protein